MGRDHHNWESSNRSEPAIPTASSQKELIAAQHGERAATRHRRASGPAGPQVIALSGAGRLAISLGELITLCQQQLPVKVIVFNNAALSFVALEMKAAAIVTYGTDLGDPASPPSPAQPGPSAMRVETADELGNAAAVVRHHGPALVTIRTGRQESASGLHVWSCACSLSVTAEPIPPGVLAGIRKR